MSVWGVWVVWYLGVESMKLWFICSKEYERLNNQLGYWNIQFSIWGFMIARYVDFGKMRRYFLFNLFLYFCSPLLSDRKISKVQCCELFWSWKRTILPPSFPPFLPLFLFFLDSSDFLILWSISVEGVCAWIIVWLLALNLCQNGASWQICVTASERLFSL